MEGNWLPEERLVPKMPGRIERASQAMGLMNRYNLFWSWYWPYNFGDWIGPYLFEKLTGRTAVHCDPLRTWPTTMVFAAGSIMRKIASDDSVIVWGSGVISRRDEFARPRRILAVRGPKTLIELSAALHGDGTKFIDYFLAGGVGSVRPRILERPCSTGELLAMADDAPMPRLEALGDSLLEACLFPMAGTFACVFRTIWNTDSGRTGTLNPVCGTPIPVIGNTRR